VEKINEFNEHDDTAVSKFRELLSLDHREENPMENYMHACALQTALARLEGMDPFHMKLPYYHPPRSDDGKLEVEWGI
jgi:hypothetical protein